MAWYQEIGCIVKFTCKKATKYDESSPTQSSIPRLAQNIDEQDAIGNRQPSDSLEYHLKKAELSLSTLYHCRKRS